MLVIARRVLPGILIHLASTLLLCFEHNIRVILVVLIYLMMITAIIAQLCSLMPINEAETMFIWLLTIFLALFPIV